MHFKICSLFSKTLATQLLGHLANSYSPKHLNKNLQFEGGVNAKDIRNFKDSDGIISLNFDDQHSEIPGKPFNPNRTKFETGKASYYAMKFKGQRTASGEIYDPDKFTAAHPSSPFGTKVRVTNTYNDASFIVRINDRGPKVKSRIIDLSYAAAKELGIISKGVVDVVLEVIQSH